MHACVMLSYSAYISHFKKNKFPMRLHWTLNNYGGKRKWCTVSHPILLTFWTKLINLDIAIFYILFIPAHTLMGKIYPANELTSYKYSGLLYEWLSWRGREEERGQGRVSQVHIHVSWPANLGRVTPPSTGAVVQTVSAQLYRQILVNIHTGRT